MSAKIKTQAGYLQILDDRAIDTVEKTFMNLVSYNFIDARNLFENCTKSYYKVVTPCGCAYIKNYGNKCEMKAFYSKKPSAPLEIITVR